MKKLSVVLLSVFLIVGISSVIQAGEKKNLPESDPLATISAGGCSTAQIAPFGTSLLASWGWTDGAGQTKFGGDAVYFINASTVSEATLVEHQFEVEFQLVQYEPGTPADAYPGKMVYRCSTAQTETTGTCNGSVLGLRSAIMAAAADYLEVEQGEITGITADRIGVYVKPMNPGKGKGRQNYTMTDVCAEDIL